MVKRITAALLAACLAFYPCVGFAKPVNGAIASADLKGTLEGTLEVEVSSSLLVPYEGKVTVSVTGADGASKEEGMELAKEATSAKAAFQVPEGDYTVTVQAEKFAKYTQKVKAEAGWTHKISVCSYYMETGASAGPGWLRPGDIDGDGDIDEADSKALLEAIRAGKKEPAYDLNYDGKADLADLDLLVNSMGEDRQSSVEKLWIPAETVLDSGTSTEGDVASLWASEGTVALKPKEDAPISEQNPVEFTAVLAKSSQAPKIGGMVLSAPMQEEDGTVSSQVAGGMVTIVSVGANGAEQVTQLPLLNNQQALSAYSIREALPLAVESDGSIVIDFGGQIAVKRVSVRITGTKKDKKLAEIAKVEFVNNMEERIPAPELDIPSITSVKPGSKKLSVAWSAQKNVTGYEVQVSGPVKNQDTPDTEIIKVSNNKHDISSIHNKSLVNYKEYTVKVRSVNGSWKSPWSQPQTGIPKPQGKPEAPDNVKAQGGYRSITVSWKNMEDADGYMVYYKETGAKEYQPVVKGFQQAQDGAGRLDSNRYTINGLKEHVSYSVYVVSWNAFGWGKKSLASVATTRSEAVPKLVSYKLLNTSNGEGKVSAHIESAAIGGSNSKMNASPLDTAKNSALGLVDNDYGSYWSKADWDDGVKYPSSSKGIYITLDSDYDMNYFTFAAADQKTGMDLVKIQYWSSGNPKEAKEVGARLLEKQDENDNPYYIVKFDATVKANKIHMSLGRSWTSYDEMKIGEIHFHQYDSLEDDIMALYKDDMHMTLREDVAKETIQALQARLEEVDGASGEKHPLYQELALELRTAEEILDAGLDPAMEVESSICAAKDKHLGFGGLNAWQPLGKVAYAGESLLVYVGHDTKKNGDAANLQLVFTQHHAEAANVSRSVSLRVGRNMVTAPQLADKDFERGGQVYIAYTGNSASDKYAVRIAGGSSIPALSIYGKSGEERTEAIREYVGKLEAYVGTIETKHKEAHTGTKNVDYTFDSQNCILDATDIMMEPMMYSLPATQIWAGLKAAQGLDAKAEKLDRALQAMEKMMALFYQHKGLSKDDGTPNTDQAPSQHLNIRYMRMFAGAFMYASGNHIGIEWGSATIASSPDSWNGFGWGIAHEIGHNINQGCYAVAEITNNYFAQLLKSATGGGTRFNYKNVYQKVTSNTIGRAADVSTQLALYWQLHLAYDGQVDDGHLYTGYKEQFDSLFFARVDTYARNPQSAPQPGLVLDGGTDQNLMRLACAAANKNILPFFERWGMAPDNATAEYAKKYGEAEAKALYYVNDAARDYRVAHPNEPGTVLSKDAASAKVQADANKVTVTVTPKEGIDTDVLLGYEIIRSMSSNGEAEASVVGFAPAGSKGEAEFVDTVYAIDNRVLSYEVKAVDKFLNYSAAADAGSVKIQAGGVLDKAGWTVSTSMASDDDKELTVDEGNPDSGYDEAAPDSVKQAKANTVQRIADNDLSGAGTYRESAQNAQKKAEITIDMHREEEVTALKYLGDPLASLDVQVSLDGKTWKDVKAGYTGLKKAKAGNWNTVWFDSVEEGSRDSWIGTYDARYVKLAFTKSGSIAIQEIELCGPSGDNIEFLGTGSGKPAVGVLSQAYAYDKEGHAIPAGSLVFTGTYKGNPAYNVVLLYDSQGNVIGNKDGKVAAGQLIFAPVPENGNLGTTSNGTWVYYIEPGGWEQDGWKGTSIRAELYRVDNAKTMEGERIVSDTPFIKVPDVLPNITLTGSKP